jgi:gamma-glutamyltranspeptidase/glutathione hydrolase
MMSGDVRLYLLLTLCALELAARHPVRARQAMVATGEPQATSAGVAILKSGGNAVDAAVGIGFALGVTHSAMGGLGGGGYMLIRFAGGKTAFLDFRERAPSSSTRDMFAGAAGKVSEAATLGWQAAGVPGTVQGLGHAHSRWGRKSWADLLKPAIRFAEQGMPVSYSRAQGMRTAAKRLEQFPESKRIFLKDGKLYEPGETIVQKDLAATLRRISEKGPREFYQGETARRLAGAMAEHGGLITRRDLEDYRVAEREVLRGNYRGYEIQAAPPSTSGGVGLLQMLGVLEGSGFEKHGAGSAVAIHWMAEAMRRWYADRNTWLGDTDHVRSPIRSLLDRGYIERLRASISPDRATPSGQIAPGKFGQQESTETTHYQVLDAEGNAVAVTYTLNSSYGSAVTVPGLGFLLNNNMDNFAAVPGQANQYGLVQGDANAIAPGKRPLSSMAPVVITKEGKLFLVAGTPGGPTITTAVLQVIINTIDFGMNAQEAIDFPRFHHQWQPDKITIERGFSPDTVALLRARGHEVEQVSSRNDMMCFRIHEGWIEGAADSRREGKAEGY